uniref:V-type proton ATPase proteolipid subunit n=1 Tax=Coptotermes formosanus TaxID=36987 RepID=R4UJB3_COPFO|nr:V-type ATpase, C subunit family protein [Coptotermes formosanus]
MGVLIDDPICPAYSPFFAYAGVAIGLFFSCLGGAYGTAKCGVGLSSASVINKGVIVRGLVAPIMAGIIGIYGLVFSIVAMNSVGQTEYPLTQGYAVFGGGIAVGFTGFSAGMCIGLAGQAGIITFAKDTTSFLSMTLTLIFGEILAIYGMVIGLILATKKADCFPK